MKLISFDIEISKVIADFSGDLFAHTPLEISCAAVAHDDVKFWQGVPQLTQEENQINGARVDGFCREWLHVGDVEWLRFRLSAFGGRERHGRGMWRVSDQSC